MPPVSVMLFSDRPSFERTWRPALAREGAEAQPAKPEDLPASVAPQRALVIDAAAQRFDEEELLASLGLARAVGAVVAVQLPVGGLPELEPLLDEICCGLVARSDADVDRIAGGMARRMDRDRRNRFEYVAVSPRGGELLVVLGDGCAQVLARPIADGDDGTEVDSIDLSDDAAEATVRYAGGGTTALRAAAFASRFAGGGARPGSSPGTSAAPGGHEPGTNGNGSSIDGARLGQRLRALRLEAGLTQAELARRTGIHRPNIARVEAGRHTPSLETLSRLAQAIGVPTTRVLGED